jgi:hypothetical protein
MSAVEKTKRDNEMLMEGYRLGLEDAAKWLEDRGECDYAAAIRARMEGETDR